MTYSLVEKKVPFTLSAATLVESRSRSSQTSWLNDFRREALSQFQSQPWPTRKTESWKYTSLAALSEESYQGEVSEIEGKDVVSSQLSFDGLEGLKLVFVDGVFNQFLSSDESALSADVSGLICQRFSELDDAAKADVQATLGQVVDSENHLFAAHNNAMLQDGLLLKVLKNTKIEKPIQVIHYSTRQTAPCLTIARLVVVVEEGAELTVVERFGSSSETQNGFVNSLTECVVGSNAQLNHYRIHLEDETAQHVGGVHVNLLANSRLNSFQAGLGSVLKRVDVVVNHIEPGAHCELSGIYLPKNKQRIDFHTDIQHRAAHCTTNEVFRGIMADEAKATFNGRIYIHPHAQQTLAELSNKNLLLSNRAEVNTKPELEIYADDVKCAHGATVSQLDGEAIAYLRSRGISREKAELMMSYGFINELVESIKIEPIKQYMTQVLDSWFGQEQ
ncbi:MAG: Fe-S cluster assembly protein SufD [Pseudomonadales bacterium]|nr:Fe-S cluster assembly protein SufD [Pseudomonadales bacterium]